jgi:hypothetical protein
MHSVIAERIVDSILGSQARRAVPAPCNGPAPTSHPLEEQEPNLPKQEERSAVTGWAEGRDRAARCPSAQ